MNYVPLHLHSAASLQWGVRPVAELCEAAREMGFEALALTDRNGLYVVPDFLAEARRCGLRPLIGAEAVHGGQRAVLLARDAEGYANLCRLLSELHCREDFALAGALAQYRRGLTILADQAELLAPLRRQGRAHLYVELSPGHQLHRALALARELGLPPVATSRALLLEPGDFELHRVLRAIALNTKLSRLGEADTARAGDLLLPPEKLAEFFPHCPQALENSRKIAAACRSDWDFSATIFPAFAGLSQDEAYARLEERARVGAKWRYGAIDERVKARLAKELTIIRAKGFADYFLVVEEIAAQSPRTCGRGSAAASLVAYCLGITHVDPIRHNLFFERFLHAGRSDPPDIDIDFPWDERDAVLDFAFARYGTRRAAMVANQIGFKGRSALREVAKVYGLPDAEIKLLTERISGYWKAEQTAGAVVSHPLFAGEKFGADWQEILRLAVRLGPQLRHLSLHCGGLVIVPDELRRYVPVEVSAKGLPVIQWEKEQAEAAGLVKIDILGNRSLAVIRDALAAVERHTGTRIDYAGWRPLDDARTRELLTAGASMGCFYIESPATRQLLRRMWLNNPHGAACDIFEHLVMASSIIRPAANRFILEFVARMHGAPWRHLHPLLAEVLEESYGIAVYQEQITQIAMALAGFSAHEGDQLRKIVCKKHKVQTLADYREKFLAGARDRGVPQAVIAAIWEQILSFAGYSFCKPHSASYALVSCKAAFLKGNHPAEFMAAVISNQGGFYTPFAYLSEARRLGLKVLPPDINQSDHHYCGKGREIRIGLMQIHGLTAAGNRALLAERERGGPYRDFGDFLRRVALDAEDVRRLVKAGCYDALEGRERRSRLLWELLARGAAAVREGNLELFAELPALPEPSGYDDRTVLNQELETLGMLVSCHPLDLHRRAIARIKPLPARELGAWAGRYVTMIGWWVTGKPVQDKDGRPMEFVTFEDTTGLFDATFFPQAYARFCRKLTRLRPYLLKGKVEEAFGVATLTVEWVGYLDEQG